MRLISSYALAIRFCGKYAQMVDTIRTDTISAAQCRMARAGLGLSITDASRESLVSRATIARFEGGREIKPVLRSALRSAFERLGVVLTESGVEIGPKGEGRGRD